MFYKEFLSALAIALTFIAFIPYIKATICHQIKPHVFSWLIWSMTTGVVFVAQLNEGGGVGAWPIGVSAIITIGIALLAYMKRADIRITWIDWSFLIAALSSLPLWYFMSDPVWTVILLTTVDVLGFGPTVRKAYSLPYSESLLFFTLFALRDVLVLLALEKYSLSTILFPAAIATSCAIVVLIICYRRRTLPA
jgi:hypothetical protein